MPRPAKKQRSLKGGAPATGGIRGYFGDVRDVRTAFLLTAPILLLYEVGIVVFKAQSQNAADAWIKRGLLSISPNALIVLNALLLVGIVAAAFTGKPRKVGQGVGLFGPLLLESCIWAMALVPIARVFTPGPLFNVVAIPGGRLEGTLLSLGAGFYEEFVFRLGLFAGGRWLLKGPIKLDDVTATGIAFVSSSLLFSAYHHIGPGGEPMDGSVFLFRVVAGAILGALFAARGFAVAVWTHVFYDVLCVLRVSA